MRFLPDNTLSIAIDYQEKLVPAMNHSDELIARAALFAKGLHILKVPMMATRQYPKGLGDTIPLVKDTLENARVYDKVCYSIYDDDTIRRAIKDLQPETILLYGIESHICVAQSAIDLCSAGYQVFVVADACGSRTERDHLLGLDRLRYENVGIVSVEAALFELTRTAKHPAFKQISALVK